MRLRQFLSVSLISSCLSISAWIALPCEVSAQGGAPTVSTVTLQVVPGQQGQQDVITPRGMAVPLPGAGVNGNSVQIYMGSQGGYWYIDRNGQNVDLTGYVQQFRSTAGQAAGQVPQYAAAPAPVQIVNEQAPSSGGSGSSGMGTAAAAGLGAGLGAMAGAAMSGAYYNNGYYNNVPYGTPVYYPRGGNPYYVNAGGNNVNVNHSYTGDTTNVKANQPNYDHHTNELEKQQQWYQNQQKENSKQFKAWQKNSGDNPFVNQENQGRRGRFGNAAAQDDSGRGGRFGRRGGDSNAGGAVRSGDEGGRFGGGGRFQRGDGGGRFAGGNAGGGGRFGRRGGN